MQYIAQIALRLKVFPPKIVNGAAGVAQNILADDTATSDEKTPVYRLFQNLHATDPLYYLIGATPCDNTKQFHGILLPYQQLDCSGHRSNVSIFSPNAYTAVATIMFRNDKYGDNIITQLE